MKKKCMKAVLKVLGTLLILSGIIGLVLYTQFWNPPVQVSVKNEGEFPLTSQQRVEDFEYLYGLLEESFPYFEVKKRQYDYDWLSQKERFIERIEQVGSDKEFYSVLNEILMLIQNGHTGIIAPGQEFDEYKNLYAGFQPWSQVFGSDRVGACYDYWATLINESDPSSIPIAFRYVEGHYYASKNLINSNLGIPLGAQLLQIGGVEVDRYISDQTNKRLLKYDSLREKFKLNLFAIHTNKETELTYRLADGKVVTELFKPYLPGNMGSTGDTLPQHLFSTEILEEGKIAYLKLPSFSSSYVEKDGEGIRTFLTQISHYPNLIVDIRGNGGGSTNYWMNKIVPLLTDTKLSTNNYLIFRDSSYLKPFIKHKMFTSYLGLKPLRELNLGQGNPQDYFGDDKGLYEVLNYTIKPINPVGFKGKITLLVDDYVYSSAEAFAVFAKASGWATLVGTRTGGDGIGFDPVSVALPNSGLVVRYPAEMGLNPDGSINEEVATMPDIYVEPSYQDFMSQIQSQSKLAQKLSVKESLPYDTILRTAVELAQTHQ